MKKYSNIDNDLLLKLNDTLNFVLNNKFSDFYQKKYADAFLQLPLQSIDDYQKIPLLIKDEFLDVPAEMRIFLPIESVARYSLSSGTTLHKKIAVMPQLSSFDNRYQTTSGLEYGENILQKMNLRNILLLWPIASSAFLRNMTVPRKNKLITPADTDNLPQAAQMAKKTSVEGIITTATILDFLVPELKAIGFDFSKILWISLGGEFCSQTRLSYLEKIFPNAIFAFRFGSSEIGGRGYQCQYLAKLAPNVFHPVPDAITEIVPNEKGSAWGEIIHTTLGERPFPLIRYKTGDVGRLEKKTCLCGNNFQLTVGGKTDLDYLKFSGITLTTPAIEKSLLEISDHFSRFQMHVWERKVNGRIKPQLEIHLQFKRDFEHLTENAIFIETMLHKISTGLQLSGKSTLADLVGKDVFLPLTVVFEKFPNSTSHKARVIISHLD